MWILPRSNEEVSVPVMIFHILIVLHLFHQWQVWGGIVDVLLWSWELGMDARNNVIVDQIVM